jgi:hypothetical protein
VEPVNTQDLVVDLVKQPAKVLVEAAAVAGLVETAQTEDHLR